jgi:methylmalonyl-CoA/ethylmalonyl-CoA epimerase
MSSEQEKPRVDLGPIIQVGLVVRDAEAAAQAWTERFNFGPARILDWPQDAISATPNGTYRGQPGNFRMRLAFIETPSIQIEFIQPLEGDNIYSEWLEQHGEGLHHLLFEVADPEAVAAGLTVPILQSGSSTLRPGAIWTYLDTQELLKCIIEFRTKTQAA